MALFIQRLPTGPSKPVQALVSTSAPCHACGQSIDSLLGNRRDRIRRWFPMARILIVVTGASYWTLKDGTRHPTGYWAEEFVAPYSAFTGAGHELTVATPSAVVPTVDTFSLRPDMAGSEQKAREEEDVIEGA